MKFHTVPEVATLLNVSPSLVYQLVESGRLPHHRIGCGRGTIRISEADLEAYLTDCHQTPRAEAPRKTPRPKLKHLKL